MSTPPTAAASHRASSRALRWSFIQQIGRVVPGYVGLIALSRILSPQDFGVVGVAGLWLGMLNAFVGAGLGPSVVQSRSLGRDELSRLASTTVLLGAAAAVAGMAVAAPLCHLLSVPQATPYAQVSSLAFAFAGFGIIPTAVAQRRLAFGRLAVRDIGSSLLSMVVGVGAALAGAQAWALVTQPLVQAAVSSVLIWHAERHEVGLKLPRWSVVRGHTAFSGHVTLFQVIKATLQTAYRAVIAAVVGTYALGLYMLGYKLAVETTAVVRAGLGGFLFPFLARRQTDVEALRRAFFSSTRGLLTIVSAGLAALVVVAPVGVPLIFGDQWRPAVSVVAPLAVVGLADCIFGTSGELLKAMGNGKGLLLWSIAYSCALLTGLVVGARLGGIEGTALGAAAAGAALVPMSLVQVGRQLHLPATRVARRIASPLAVPTIAAAVALSSWAALPRDLAILVAAVALVGLLGRLGRDVVVLRRTILRTRGSEAA